MGVRKAEKPRSDMFIGDSNGNHGNQKKDDETLYMKDLSVNFEETNGHHAALETTSSKRFWLPKTRTYENTVLEFKNIETAKSHIKETLKKYSTILFVLGAVAAFLSIVDSQITIWRRRKILKIRSSNETQLTDLERLDLYTGVQISARSIISILSVTTTIYLYIYYSHLHTLSVLRNTLPPSNGFWFSKLFISFLIEIIVCLVHIPPGINAFPEEAQLIVFSRFYLIARFLKQKHKLMNSKSTRFLASVTKTDLSSVFLLKTYFMRQPFILIVSTYMITVVFGGYAVYLVEREKSYVDTIWMLIVTMTTVGFGDFVPQSVTARAFTAVIAVIGIFLMALCISLVHESLQLTQQEKRILAYTENTEHLRLVKDTAARSIQMWWRYTILVQKGRQLKGPKAYFRVKVSMARSKLYAIVSKWRTLKGCKDDHWKKEFLGDNTAMLLTDVSRDVKNIQKLICENFNIESQSNASLDKGDENVEANQQIDNQWNDKRTVDAHIEKSPQHLQNHISIAQVNLSPGAEDFRETPNQFTETDNLLYSGYNQPRIHSRSTSGVSSFHGYSISPSPTLRNNLKDIEAMIVLIQNQIRVMNGSLDEMYTKSKQELRDLENLVSCVCHVHRNIQLEATICSNCRMISQLRSSSC